MTIILTFLGYLPVYQALLWCLGSCLLSACVAPTGDRKFTVVLPAHEEGIVAEAVT